MMSIPPDIMDIALRRLEAIEREHSVRILFAIESGSRAWGFESKDSDYDIRFIYKRERDWYLSILPRRDVIEYPIVDLMDYSGWDLRKAFFLANKSNPVLFEWLQSPIVYRKHDAFYDIFRRAVEPYFSGIGGVYHYLHMAKNNFREYLKKDRVKLKKYFYVLRPVFCCLWIEKYNSIPPMEFEKVMTGVLEDATLIGIIRELLEQKRAAKESGLSPMIPEINAFIERNLEHFEDFSSSYNPREKPDPEILNTAFLEILDL